MTTDFKARITQETFIRFVEAHDSLPSTSDRAAALVQEGSFLTPALIFAEQQSAGRGRGSNSWIATPGSLTFSVILCAEDHQLSGERLPLVALLAGLAIRDAMNDALPTGNHSVQIKWPNDVYLNDRKVCGILSEAVTANAGDRYVILGVGINVNNCFDSAPAEVSRKAVSLYEVNKSETDRTQLLISLLTRLEIELAEFQETGQFPRTRFASHCWLTGREVTVTTPTSSLHGRCVGVGDAGQLLVEQRGETVPVRSGSVTLFES
ncbi:biotin--[acetyl-CoA-carboxylase] ligase [Calycomorphotria hydatis]|uniref:biotin--[biotin carboxyl-carrier protein] ligase n=1 Tax=Calycomorphotria hydatis TaxID=2528027 RepID=A0A517TF16_9PLAN|nr:biotin--[acetyl-CoA-carboxylase] ligase [Calycomorphotria hydatis]QDT66965.1 Bifunctional ligase/repressor BirA [Calycomorphotria hydatis]